MSTASYSARSRSRANSLVKFKASTSILVACIIVAIAAIVSFAGVGSAVSVWDSPLGLGITLAVLIVLLGAVSAALSAHRR